MKIQIYKNKSQSVFEINNEIISVIINEIGPNVIENFNKRFDIDGVGRGAILSQILFHMLMSLLITLFANIIYKNNIQFFCIIMV